MGLPLTTKAAVGWLCFGVGLAVCSVAYLRPRQTTRHPVRDCFAVSASARRRTTTRRRLAAIDIMSTSPTNSPGEIQYRRGQICSTLTALLRFVDASLPHDLWYVVSYGTLLATVRDGGCIVDLDMDIAVTREQVPAVEAALRSATHANPYLRLLKYEQQQPPVDTDFTPLG